MSEAEIAETQRKARAIVFQAAGLFDVALGIGLAVFGPGFIGREPTTDLVLWIMGGALALFGLAMWWWGRFRLGARASMARSRPLVRRLR